MPFETVYLLTPRGQRYGPLTIDEVRTWTRERRVPLRSVLIDDSTGESCFVEDFPEVARELSFKLFGYSVSGNRPAIAGFILSLLSVALLWFYILPGSIVAAGALFYSWTGHNTAKSHPCLGGGEWSLWGLGLSILSLFAGAVFIGDFLFRFTFGH